MSHLFQVAVSAFIIRNGRLLLLKRREDDDFLPGYWEVPGGKIEEHESIEEGAVRETQEEAGIEVSIGKVFGYFEYVSGNGKKTVNLNFLCQMEADTTANVGSGEMERAEWVSETELLHYKMSESMHAACLQAFSCSHH